MKDLKHIKSFKESHLDTSDHLPKSVGGDIVSKLDTLGSVMQSVQE